MSGATLFARPRPPVQGPLEKRLALEDSRPIVRSIGVGQVIGAWIIAWALTVQVLIPPMPYEGPDVDDDFREPPKITFVLPPKDAPSKPTKRQPHQNNGRKAISRNPSKEAGQIQVRTLDSRTGDAAKSAFAIIRDAIKSVDIDKIEGATRLTKTDPTRIAGRPGMKREGFNLGFSDGNGKDTEIDLRSGNTFSRIEGSEPKIPGGAVASASTIQISDEGRFRSSESILAVVRAHSPGLRHLYNTHLKVNPGLNGKVTVRFAVSPSGLVVDAAVDRSTTGSPAFEREVLAKIRSWRFDAIKAVGNDIVTVPFNFSE